MIRRRTAGARRRPRRARSGPRARRRPRAGGRLPASRGSGRRRRPSSRCAAPARSRPPRSPSPRRARGCRLPLPRMRPGSGASADPGRTTAGRRSGCSWARAARRGAGRAACAPREPARRPSLCLAGVTLTADLERIAAAAQAYAADDEAVAAILATEPDTGVRIFLCAFSAGAERTGWIALDEDARPIDDREALRAHLVDLRVREQPPGIEEAEAAALALERAVGAPPRIATPAYLDAVGDATRELERALGDDASPFAAAMQGAVSVVNALQAEVEGGYKLPLD